MARNDSTTERQRTGSRSWDSFEPYVQLVRSLLPRAASVALFDTRGEMRWSSEPTTGPDLINVVDDALATARTAPDSAGQLRMLAGNMPVYLCWLRDDSARLLAVVAVVCRPTPEQDTDARSFSLCIRLVATALECLRRDLVARAAIDELNRTVTALDKDLELLLADGTADHPSTESGADDLKGILQQAVEHLRCPPPLPSSCRTRASPSCARAATGRRTCSSSHALTGNFYRWHRCAVSP